MKKQLILVSLLALIFVINCNGQPKTNYEVYSNTVSSGAKYHFFLEKKSATAYKLIQGMDYLSPNVVALKVGEATTPVFTVNLGNDGSEYTVGVVVENAGGYYSGMGVAVGTVGVVPPAPGGVGLRKKN
jgi:hypothetical protein